MNNYLNQATQFVAKGTLQHIDDALGSAVHFVSGRLWLTQQNDRRDIVLEAGDAVRIERPGTSILYALRDARYMLLPAPAASVRSGAAAHA